MNNLINFEKQSQKVITSLEIAEMAEISHKELLRKLEGGTDRKGYIKILGEHQMVPTDYFVKSMYLTGQNKEMPCYLFTKMGCEFIANKFTGEKGILFTAKYVKRFNEMESAENNVYKLPTSYKEALQQLLAEVEEKEKLTLQIDEMKPKVSYFDLVMQCKDLVSVSQIAKDYGKSAQWLNSLLHDLGVQYNQGGVWLLYQKKYGDKGYTQSKTAQFIDSSGLSHAKPHTYWTQKGRLFIYNLLKENGYLPVMEREYCQQAIRQQ